MSATPKQPERPVRLQGERSRWLVPSASQPSYPVLVDMDEYDGIGWCACEDFQFRKQPLLERGERGPGLTCKHIEQVLIQMGKESAFEAAKQYQQPKT